MYALVEAMRAIRCANPECGCNRLRDAIGPFVTLRVADAYRLRMHYPDEWMLVRIGTPDPKRDWCQEGGHDESNR